MMLIRTTVVQCNYEPFCLREAGRSLPSILLNELVLISRVLIELGIIFLLIQLIHRAIVFTDKS